MAQYLFDELKVDLTEDEREAIYGLLTPSSGAALSHDQVRLGFEVLLKTIDAATAPKKSALKDEGRPK